MLFIGRFIRNCIYGTRRRFSIGIDFDKIPNNLLYADVLSAAEFAGTN